MTDAKSVLQELQAVVPTNPSVPVQPLILDTQEEPPTGLRAAAAKAIGTRVGR